MFTKPSTEGALDMTARELRKAVRSGVFFRLVRVTGHPEDKIRPHRKQWPLVISAGEIDRGDYDTEAETLIVVAVEGRDGYPWHFAPETVLTVVPDEPPF